MVCSDNSNALVDMHLTIFWGALRAVPGPCLPGLPLAINHLQKTFLYIYTGYAEFFWLPKLESPGKAVIPATGVPDRQLVGCWSGKAGISLQKLWKSVTP
jgi:hypothetical protein